MALARPWTVAFQGIQLESMTCNLTTFVGGFESDCCAKAAEAKKHEAKTAPVTLRIVRFIGVLLQMNYECNMKSGSAKSGVSS